MKFPFVDSMTTLQMITLILLSLYISTTTALSNTPMSTGTPPKILSVGLSAVDFVATVDHYPEPDEKMRSSSLLVEGGGNAANTACAIAGLFPIRGCSNLLTAVGDDPNGNIIIDGLQSRNVNVIVEKYPGNSPFSYILSHNDETDGSNTRTCIHQPSSGDMSIGYVTDDDNVNVKDMTAVHFDVRYPTAAMALAKKCVELNIPYSVDVERPREGLEEILRGASVVICNSNYCKTVDEKKGEGGTVECLTRVMKQQAPNAKIAVQTLGSDGSCLVFLDDDVKAKMISECNGKERVILLEDKDDSRLPVVTLSSDGSLTCSACSGGAVVDSTGAGDAFIGGFLSALWSYAASLDGDNRQVVPTSNVYALGRALRIGSRVAARKIEKSGARSGLPTIDDDYFLKMEFDALSKEPSSSKIKRAGSGLFQKVLSLIK